MCTVTYLPTDDGCIITSNRDEITSRGLASVPAKHLVNNNPIVFPKDPLAGGTWIAGGRGGAVCLFNGAFEKHHHSPPYKHSRGLVPLSFFDFESIEDFIANYEFDGIEPFSMVMYDGEKIDEVKWDGSEAFHFEHDPSAPHIWASATLYDKSVRAQREQWFSEWLFSNPSFTQESIIDFHTSKNQDTQNGLLINRNNGLKTVSVCSLQRFKKDGSLHTIYRELVNDQKHLNNWSW